MTLKTLSVPCPTCQKEVLMTEKFPDRPFCSARCKNIDFGEWAAEEKRIEGDSSESDAWSDDLNSLD